MNEALLFGLLFVAAAIGWWFGSRGRPVSDALSPSPPSQYYRGLNYILDGHSDGAVDAFVSALEVNSETVETHIALGNLLRKRGEVDRAIRIHQNLLARPSLPRPLVYRAHLELARDYISAGLFDRAERLLLDLQQESPEHLRICQHYLLEIYQSEREWGQAIDVASQLLPRKQRRQSDTEGPNGQAVVVVLAHYCCEMAAEHQQAGELAEAGRLLRRALQYDGDCVRASIMQGEIETAAAHYPQAIKALRRVQQQDADFVVETITLLHQCYGETDDRRALCDYLQACLDARPSAPLVLAIVDNYLESGDAAAASEFLSQQLALRPSLRGLARMISLQMDQTEGAVRENLGLLQELVDRLIAERPAYRCGACGFAGRHLHWHCPGCKRWGTIKAVHENPVD
ncbi:MAG: lipopolysaccharide assembly protein LapB [Parahaliea sp.]